MRAAASTTSAWVPETSSPTSSSSAIRSERGARRKRFDSVRGTWEKREFVTVTGVWKGLPVTIMATGIGCDNTEIAVVELSSLVEDATLIRAGSCGGLQEHLELGDLVVTWGAVRLETTSLNYVPEGYPAVAHPEVSQALLEAAKQLELPHHFGMTATTAGFYGAQGRANEHFAPRDPKVVDRLARIGVMNLEMETSTSAHPRLASRLPRGGRLYGLREPPPQRLRQP